MKKLIFILTAIFTLTISNELANGQGGWVQKGSFSGTARGDAFYFSIGNKGYIGGGEDISGTYVNDFWEYDAISNYWTQKASFPGGTRCQAVSFNIGSKGYVGTGSGSGGLYNDFWEYDPSTDTWTQKANLPAEARTAGIGFSIGNKGYLGTGYGCSPVPCTETNHNDFWEYDPAADTWSQKANIPTNGRGYAFGLSIGSKGYVGTGHDDYGNIFNDFWEYNPLTDVWTQKTNYPSGQRNDIDGAHFTIGNYGYVGTGCSASVLQLYNDFWRYDPTSDIWTQIPNLPAQARIGSINFSINNKGYIGLGFWVTSVVHYLDDLWSFSDTTSQVGINEVINNNSISFSPNPFSIQTTLWSDHILKNATIIVYNSYGQAIKQIINISGYTITLHCEDLANGMYFIRLIQDNKISLTDKVVITDN